MKKCRIFYECIQGIIELIILAFAITLCALSSKDPFKSHIIGNITDYFKINLTNSNIVEYMCICNNNITYDHSCSEEKVIEGCLNIVSDIVDFKPLSKRILVSDSFCTDMQESFIRNQGKQLSYIFNLRYQVIRKVSIASTTVTSSLIALNIALICIVKNNCDTNGIFIIIISLLSLIGYIAKFVLFLLLYHFIESGDIGKYDDFLDCKNVRKEFFEKFKGINSLRKIFLGFAILNIISESLGKAKELFEVCVKESKKDGGVSSMNSSSSVS